MNKLRLLSLVLAALMILSLAGCGQTPTQEEPTQTTAASKEYAAPDFTVLDSQGNSVKLSDFKGKVVVLNFWASWCAPCKGEMPDFQQVFEKNDDRVVFMMVNLTDGTNETLATAKNHIASCGYTFPVYFDTTMEAANAYYISSIPTTFFIDSNGNMVTYATGAISADLLERGIQMALGEYLVNS